MLNFIKNAMLDTMNHIWDHGIRVWSEWQDRLPIAFDEVRQRLTAGSVPMYSSGRLSQILLYGDLSRLGIILPPTESEMGKLIWDSRSGSWNGLHILGVAEPEKAVSEAVCRVRTALNDHLSSSAKSLFHTGKVTSFDLEHALCKISRKQRCKDTRSPISSTLNEKRKASEYSGSQRKAKPRRKRQRLNYN